MSGPAPRSTDRKAFVPGDLRPPIFPGDEDKWRKCDMEMIHVVFANDGSVRKISGCPEGLTPQGWFNFLSRNTRDRYESLSGGRGVFRFEPEELLRVSGEAAGSRA
jgi:hypothetical protein